MNDQSLIDQFLANHPELAMASIEEMEINEMATLITHISIDQSIMILSQMAQYKAGKVLEHVSLEYAIRLVEKMSFLTAESFLRITTIALRNQILNGLPPETAKVLRRSLSFSKNQVGAHIESQILTLNEKLSVEGAIIEVKRTSASLKPHIYVVNNKRKLVGYIEATTLLYAKKENNLRSVMKTMKHSVFAEMSVKDALANWDDSFVYLPVLRPDREFIGVVSRSVLVNLDSSVKPMDNPALKAGNALGELYLIGLNGLLGNSDQPKK